MARAGCPRLHFFPLYEASKLDLMYWDMTPGDISIVKARTDVSELPIYELERQHRDVERCLNAGHLQFYSTQKQTCRIAGLSATVPDSPQIVAVQVLEGAIEITVDGYNGGADITQYEATCTGGETSVTGIGTTSVIRVTGVPAGDYVCSVVAVNSVGQSAVSSQTSPLTVIVDTDGDGVDDASDPDDDNDGYLDTEEAALGSDPLDAESTPVLPGLSMPLLFVAVQGVAETPTDDDADGVLNLNDLCPNTPSGAAVDADGCSDSQKDDDGDGVANSTDLCANTPAGESVNAVGCSQSQTDSDGDGVSDDIDQCPNTSPGTDVDSSGCANAEAEVERVYIESVDPLIQAANCTSSNCHGRNAAPGGLVLRSLSTSNATALNYASMVNYINSRGSTRLMNKIAGVGHGGSEQYSSSSSAYATIQAWARSVEALP